MQRDAHLLSIRTTTDLSNLLSSETIAPSIAGFVVTDASIMDPEDKESLALAKAVVDLIKHPYSVLGGNSASTTTNTNTNTNTTENGTSSTSDSATGSNSASTSISNSREGTMRKENTVIFAFSFPAQAALRPLRFNKFISQHFGVSWRLCGATMGRVKLEICEPSLRNMGSRVYRGNRYEMRGVFLEGVEEGDKVLVVARGASVRNGGLGRQGQPEGKISVAGGDCVSAVVKRVGKEGEEGLLLLEQGEDKGKETDSTAAEDGDYEIERVQTGGPDGWTNVPLPSLGIGTGAGDAGGGHADLEDVEMVDEADLYREEHDWADDELNDTGKEDQDEDEDEQVDASDETSSSSSSSCSGGSEGYPEQRVIYVDSPNRRLSHTMAEDSDASSDKFDPRKNKKNKKKAKPKRIADCPVAIHEVRSWTDRDGQRVRARGYVGFVGHVEDNRSMASLILGMCAVRNTTPLPAAMRDALANII
ncbi:hypothetical protein BJX61DRAFT_545237 [Aspergillus egyptiacus]|nr:hypothetical protein BJX61DRAFT_545237 [Aspergillus egyptiacus]